MKRSYLTTVLIMIMCGTGCKGQNEEQMTNRNNPLNCNPETGICELPDTTMAQKGAGIKSDTAPVKLIYFTDPICSSCWGIEPQLRRLELEYGHAIDIEYHMGGLLPDWSYNSGGISKPSDVAHHWDEVSHYYDMPIDGDVWLQDPLPSSYPPSIAFRAASLQSSEKTHNFLRRMREMVFLERKNITRREHLSAAATACGLDTTRLWADYEQEGRHRFEADLKLAREMGVRGFPSLFFVNAAGTQVFVYGSRPYEEIVAAVKKLNSEVSRQTYAKNWQDLFAHFPTLTAREYAELSGQPRANAEKQLQELTTAHKLTRYDTKNGSLWRVRQ